MKFCTKCGAQLYDEAVVCPQCGCPTSDYRRKSSKYSEMAALVKIFMILCCVFLGLFFPLSLAWTIPMTVIINRRLVNHEPIGLGLKICTVLFCGIVAGVLLLCMDTDTYME